MMQYRSRANGRGFPFGRRFAVAAKGALLLAGCGLASVPAVAKDVVVRMKTVGKGGVMVYEPAFVRADVGDRVRFVPTDAGHNAEPIAGMLPAGVVAAKGAMNKEYVLTLTKPGLYGIKCLPHYAMGMIALVKAGNGAAPNAGQVAAASGGLPPLAKKRMLPMLAQAR